MLKSLVLIGDYDQSFFGVFQQIFKDAENLRLLRVSATCANFISFLRNLVSCTHLRYIKLEKKQNSEALPIHVSKFYHLEASDVGIHTIVHGMDNLVSMRYFVVTIGARSSGSVGETSNRQDVQNFTDQNSSCFEITQLQSMNNLVQLGMFHLENISGAEAYRLKLRDKQHLEKLHLSWKDTRPQYKYDCDAWSESEDESPQVDDSSAGPQISEYFANTARVLECLEPHHNLKHLRVSGYSGATSPSWLATSVSCLHTLHLEDCGERQKLPHLGRLTSLTKLKLRNMQKVTEVWIPSLGELVLIEMPKLERCSSNSVTDLNSSLRILKIKRCRVLKAMSLFESCGRLKNEQKSWLSQLRELTIHDCPQLTVPKPLPPSSSVCKLSILGVPTLPRMDGSPDGKLLIEALVHFGGYHDSSELTILDDKILSFHNLRGLTSLTIAYCSNLSSISLEGFRQLISLRSLKVMYCGKLLSSAIHEGMAEENFNALPSLERLVIDSCGIAGKWLSVMLRHAPALEELHVDCCLQISGLLIEWKENSSSNLTSAPPRNPDDALTSSTPDKVLRIPSNLIPSLKKMNLEHCPNLITLEMSKEGFSGFTSLEYLKIWDCAKLIPSLVHKDESNNEGNGRWLLPHSLDRLDINHSAETLQLCFQENRNCLKQLVVSDSPSLKCLQLHSCTALEELRIEHCNSLAELDGSSTCLKKLDLRNNRSLESVQLHCCTALEGLEIQRCGCLTTLEGLQSLSGLRHLRVWGCPGLLPYVEDLSSTRGYELFPRLETLEIDNTSFLSTSFCMHHTSLQQLEIRSDEEVGRLTDEQETALQFLKSLKELSFLCCVNLANLPVGLHSLPFLKRLEIWNSPRISRLPATGLPPSLEELEIWGCSEELNGQCRMQATDKLKVQIDGEYVN